MEAQTGDARRPLTQFSSRYISYLNGGERRQLKGCAAPADGYVAVGMLNGQKVERKGRGQPPASNKEAEQGRHGRRIVPGRSYFAADRLLRPSMSGLVGEPEQHFSRKVAARHNTSSMSGAGALLPESAKLPQGAAPERKVCRRPGSANPGRGLDSAMAATLAFEPEAQLRSQASQLWRAAGMPSLCDSIIRHRMSDPDTPAAPAKLEVERPPSPGVQGMGLTESRSAYFGAQHEYVSNKAHSVYGFSHGSR